MNSLVSRVVFFFFLSLFETYVSQILLNFRIKDLQISMEFKWKNFNPNSMMQILPHRGVHFPNLFFEDNAHAKFGGVKKFSDL